MPTTVFDNLKFKSNHLRCIENGILTRLQWYCMLTMVVTETVNNGTKVQPTKMIVTTIAN